MNKKTNPKNLKPKKLASNPHQHKIKHEQIWKIKPPHHQSIKHKTQTQNFWPPKHKNTKLKIQILGTKENRRKERVWFSYLSEKPTQNQLKPTQNSTIWNPTINDPPIWNSTQTTNPKPLTHQIHQLWSLLLFHCKEPRPKLLKLQSFVVDHDSHKLQWVLSRLGLGFHIKFSANDFFLLVSAWVSVPRPLFPSHLLWLGLSSMRGWSAELERAKGRSWTTRESERGKECVCVEVVGAFNFFGLF